LAAAYRDWVASGSLKALRWVAADGRERWRNLAGEMLEMHARLGDAVGAQIERRVEQRIEALNPA